MKRRNFVLLPFAAAALAACGDQAAEAPAAAPGPAARPSPREAYDLAATANGFTVGQLMAAHPVYVFFDTTCPHCAELWASSKPLLGKLKVVWIPIGLLKRSSAPQGATILSAPDPSAAMAENEASVLQRGGGIAVNPSLSDEALAKVKTNTEIYSRLGESSVPLIVFRNARTGEFGVHAGSVRTDQLAAMTGV